MPTSRATFELATLRAHRGTQFPYTIAPYSTVHALCARSSYLHANLSLCDQPGSRAQPSTRGVPCCCAGLDARKAHADSPHVAHAHVGSCRLSSSGSHAFRSWPHRLFCRRRAKTACGCTATASGTSPSPTRFPSLSDSTSSRGSTRGGGGLEIMRHREAHRSGSRRRTLSSAHPRRIARTVAA